MINTFSLMIGITLFLTVILLLAACSSTTIEVDPQAKPDELLTKLKSSIAANDYKAVKFYFKRIEHYYPDSPEYADAKNLYNTISPMFKLASDYDDILGITWYKPEMFKGRGLLGVRHHYPFDDSRIYLYIGCRDQKSDLYDSECWLRLRIIRRAPSWMFFDTVYLSYDGNTKLLLFDMRNKKTDVFTGGVLEWVDMSVTGDMEIFLRQLAESKKAKIRLSAETSFDRGLGGLEKYSLLQMLNCWDALKSTLHMVNTKNK